MKVALVHDYLKEYGGAEWVVENFHQLFPDAPIFVSYCDFDLFGKKGPPSPRLRRVNKHGEDWDIHTSFMQKIPGIKKMLAPLKFLSPMAFESFDFKDFDLVISTSAAYYAKSVITGPQTLHIGYIHTPPRYLYGITSSHGYRKHWWTRIGGEILNHFMRIADYEVSQRPDILVANSEAVQKRIKKFYGRESVVIYPPVDIKGERGKGKGERGEYFLYLGRLDPHKRIDLIVETFNQLNIPLKIAGSGRQESQLRKIAGKNVEILGRVSDEQKHKLLSGATAFIAAAEDEDFGITVVEAQAAGTPVIALRAGGYLETVIEGKTGEFFDELTEESLSEVVKNFDPKKYKESELRKNAEKYSQDRFKKEIGELIEKNLKLE